MVRGNEVAEVAAEAEANEVEEVAEEEEKEKITHEERVFFNLFI